jgi:uncharacterized protein YggE
LFLVFHVGDEVMGNNFLLRLLILLWAMLIPSAAAWAAEATSPTINVDAEGKVLAKPDLAILDLEVETQAPQAQAAAGENARRSEGLLQALKKVLGPEEKVQSLSYRLTPLRSYQSKAKPEAITGYQTIHRFKVEVRDLARLGTVMDTAFQNGASRVNGPYWGHSRLEELQRQAAVEAFAKARRLAEALAQAAGVKVKGLQKVTTHQQIIYPRGPGEAYLKAAPAPPTPVEVGEEEIKAHVAAVFEVGP